MNLNAIKTGAVTMAQKSAFALKKASPEILTVVGIGCVVGGTVMACKATLKCEDVLAQHEHGMDMIHEARTACDEEHYSEQDMKRDMAVQYVHTAAEFVKLYGPAVLVGATGIACILGGHHILKKRNVALMAAYKALNETFMNYRHRVMEEHGEETDRLYATGKRKEIIEIEDPDNPKKKKKVEMESQTHSPSLYARFFDEASSQWSKNPEYNLLFLKQKQREANSKLKLRGHLFLNEVYDMLDIPRSQAGAVVGWINHPGEEDQVDFGIYDLYDPEKRAFINGWERSILLDFNVDGVIYEMI